MPRSYSFDHFTAKKQSVSPRGRERAKRQYLESELDQVPPSVEQGLHYGHRFAETEETLHARALSAPAPGSVRAGARAVSSKAELPRVEIPFATAPIGSVPMEESQDESVGSYQAIWQDAERAARTLMIAAQDASRAGSRLVRVPRDLFHVTAQSLRQLRRKLIS